MKTPAPTHSPTPAPPTTRRVRMLIRRALREKLAGNKHHQKSREAITLALQNGLAIDQPVQIEILDGDGRPEKKWVRIKNNFAGDVAFKKAFVSHYELEDVPKYQQPGATARPPKQEAA